MALNLISALSGLFGALVGAVVSIATTYFSQRWQAGHAQKARLFDERKAFYATTYEGLSEWKEMIEEALGVVRERGKVETLLPQFARLDEMRKEIRNATARAAMLGSPEFARAVTDAAHKWGALVECAKIEATMPRDEVVRAATDRASEAVRVAHIRVVGVARADLGVEALTQDAS